MMEKIILKALKYALGDPPKLGKAKKSNAERINPSGKKGDHEQQDRHTL
jgi:hypothetical protein